MDCFFRLTNWSLSIHFCLNHYLFSLRLLSLIVLCVSFNIIYCSVGTRSALCVTSPFSWPSATNMHCRLLLHNTSVFLHCRLIHLSSALVFCIILLCLFRQDRRSVYTFKCIHFVQYYCSSHRREKGKDYSTV